MKTTEEIPPSTPTYPRSTRELIAAIKDFAATAQNAAHAATLARAAEAIEDSVGGPEEPVEEEEDSL